MRVALTGGIATGKTFCLNHFKTLGAATIDADAVSREVVMPGTPALDAILRRFGPAIVEPDGSLNREALSRIAFGDSSARQDLEAIVHPAVYQRIEAWFASESRTGGSAGQAWIGIAEIPLLYETGREGDFDAVVVAACDTATQIARLAVRAGAPSEHARQRIQAQWPIDEKRKRADYVIDTGGTEADTRKGVEGVWASLQSAARASTTRG